MGGAIGAATRSAATARRVPTVAARRPTQRIKATGSPRPHGAVPPRLPNVVGPTAIGALRVTLTVSGLQRGLVAVTQPTVGLLRSTRAPGATNAPTIGIPPTTPSSRPAPGRPRLPVVVPKQPMAQHQQPPKEGPLVIPRVTTALVTVLPVEPTRIPLAVGAIRVGPAMTKPPDGVIRPPRLTPPVPTTQMLLDTGQANAEAKP